MLYYQKYLAVQFQQAEDKQGLNLQYQWRPYDVHTVYLRLAYTF